MQQLSNLAGWPPQGGAGAFDTRKESFVKTPESVTFRKVDRIVGTRVDLLPVRQRGRDLPLLRFR